MSINIQVPSLQPARMNGCFNRPPFRNSTLVQDGYTEVDGRLVPKFRHVPFRMSRACNYKNTAEGRADLRCAGCKHLSDDPLEMALADA